MKCTQNLESSLALHGCQERNLRLSGRSSKEPEAKAIGRNRDYTRVVEDVRCALDSPSVIFQ